MCLLHYVAEKQNIYFCVAFIFVRLHWTQLHLTIMRERLFSQDQFVLIVNCNGEITSTRQNRENPGSIPLTFSRPESSLERSLPPVIELCTHAAPRSMSMCVRLDPTAVSSQEVLNVERFVSSSIIVKTQLILHFCCSAAEFCHSAYRSYQLSTS